MTTKTSWDPSKHPRGPLGRFIDVAQLAPSGRANARLRAAQEQTRDWRSDTEIGDAGGRLTNIYRRGAMFEGTKAHEWPDRVVERVDDYMYSSDLNGRIRSGDPLSRYDQESVEALDAIVSESRLTQDLRVYRGITDEGMLREAQLGDQILDRGFTSTSLDPGVATAFGDDVLEIELPAGTNAAPISKFNPEEFGHQSEILIGRGAVFEIDSIEPMEGTRWLPVSGDSRRLIRARLVGYVED